MGVLTQSRVKELMTLDESTGVLYWRKMWMGRNPSLVAGTFVPKDNRWRLFIDNKGYYRARVVFLYVHGWMPKYIDHRDRNPTNDNPDNLRPATHSQNNVNTKGRPKKMGLPKGVFLQTLSKKNPFCARIQVNGVKIYLGCFPTVELALERFRRASEQYFGEFAYNGYAEKGTSQLDLESTP